MKGNPNWKKDSTVQCKGKHKSVKKVLDKLCPVFMVAGVAVSAHDNYKDLKGSGLKGTNYVSALATNTAVDVVVGSAIADVSMTVGAGLGALIPIPNPIAGAAIGFGIGMGLNYFANNAQFGGNSLTGHIKNFVTNTYKTKNRE